MKLMLETIKNVISLFGSLIQMFWNIIKFIFSKCWKFILIIGSLLFGISAAKKACKEE